jgi:imidazolonepropionase-like amidohydrolase
MNTARKVDWIKIFVTEGLDGDPSRMQFTETDIVATVEEATASGIPVQAHALGDEGAQAAIRAGVRSIEHGSYMTDTTLAIMNGKGVYFVPTLRILAYYLDNAAAPPVVRSRLRETLPAARRTIQQARKIGVRIVTGTDSDYGPNRNLSVSHEVGELVGIGLTPIEALRSATIIGAHMLRLERSVGVLEAGYQADLLAVRGNPLENVATLLEPSLVLSNGRIAFLKPGLAIK